MALASLCVNPWLAVGVRGPQTSEPQLVWAAHPPLATGGIIERNTEADCADKSQRGPAPWWDRTRGGHPAAIQHCLWRCNSMVLFCPLTLVSSVEILWRKNTWWKQTQQIWRTQKLFLEEWSHSQRTASGRYAKNQQNNLLHRHHDINSGRKITRADFRTDWLLVLLSESKFRNRSGSFEA